MKTKSKVVLFAVVICLFANYARPFNRNYEKYDDEKQIEMTVAKDDDAVEEKEEKEIEINKEIVNLETELDTEELIKELEITEIIENDKIEESAESIQSIEEVPEETKEVAVIMTSDSNDNLISLGQFTLTAYCSCVNCCGEYALNRPLDENGNEIVYGASGAKLIAGVSIAVDPNVIPYGTKVVINGRTYIAHDTGGAIKGNRIDVYFDNHEEAWNFGLQYAEVFVAKN